MTPILVVGQSHVAALRSAARSRRESDPEAPRTRVIHTLEERYAPEIVDEGSEPRFALPLDAAIAEQLGRHQPLVASVIGGNFHNALALIRHDRHFDFHLSDEPSPPIDTDAEPVPEAFIAAALREGMARDLLRLRLLVRAAGSLVHLESPPPIRSDRFIQEAADAYFRQSGIAARGVAPAGLRYRMWRLNSRVVRAEVQALGCRFLPVPPDAQDSEGFLRPELAADATHGNEAYGELLIRALEGCA